MTKVFYLPGPDYPGTRRSLASRLLLLCSTTCPSQGVQQTTGTRQTLTLAISSSGYQSFRNGCADIDVVYSPNEGNAMYIIEETLFMIAK
jgi:hypothetical protein